MTMMITDAGGNDDDDDVCVYRMCRVNLSLAAKSLSLGSQQHPNTTRTDQPKINFYCSSYPSQFPFLLSSLSLDVKLG